MSWDWAGILGPIATEFANYGSIVLVGFVAAFGGYIALRGAISIAVSGIRSLINAFR